MAICLVSIAAVTMSACLLQYVSYLRWLEQSDKGGSGGMSPAEDGRSRNRCLVTVPEEQ